MDSGRLRAAASSFRSSGVLCSDSLFPFDQFQWLVSLRTVRFLSVSDLLAFGCSWCSFTDLFLSVKSAALSSLSFSFLNSRTYFMYFIFILFIF